MGFVGTKKKKKTEVEVEVEIERGERKLPNSLISRGEKDASM